MGGGQHLPVVERLTGEAGGGVGDQRYRQHLRAEVARGDRLEHGGHADQVGARGAQHPDLRGRLVVRPGERGVDAFLERGVVSARQGAQPLGVHLGEVGEPRRVPRGERPGQRGAAREVQVIADQHRLADAVRGVDAARRVGQHDRPAAGRDRGAHAMYHGVRLVPFVHVHPAEKEQYPAVTAFQVPNGRCMTLGGRLLEPAQAGEGYFEFRRADGVGGGQPAGAEHDGGVEARHPGGLLQGGGAGFGARERVLLGCDGHGADHLAPRRRCHGPCYKPVISVTEWRVNLLVLFPAFLAEVAGR